MSEQPEGKGKAGIVATLIAAIVGAGAIGSCMSKGAKTAKIGRSLERFEDSQSFTRGFKNSESPEEQNSPSVLDIMSKLGDAQSTVEGVDKFGGEERQEDDR